MSDDLNDLIRKRGIVKGRLTRFDSFLTSITEDLLGQLPARIKKCRECWDEFDTLQTSIEQLDKSPEQESERESFEDTYFKLITIAESKLTVSNVSITNSNAQGSRNIGQTNQIDKNVKLPIMEIPSFQGSYKEWLEFHDTFKALIHTNANLTGIQKFYYLKNSLKGDAAEVIRALEVSEQNYVEAWKLLRDRFENKKLIALSHIDSMYNFPQIQKESFQQLRKLLDVINRDTRSLKSLGQPIDSWDTLLIYILENKLDPTTKREWQKSVPSNAFSKITEFLEFLEKKCQLLEAIDSGKNDHKLSNKFMETKGKLDRQHVSRSFVTVSKPCGICRENHFLFSCKKFQNLSISAKRDEIKKSNACWNCLKYGHRVEQCPLGGCKLCGKKHNTLLHGGEQVQGKSVGTSAGSDQNSMQAVNYQQSETQTVSQNYQCTANVTATEILLSTALVHIVDGHGNLQECRTLLDSGSQSNFMTKELWERLQLPTQKIRIPVAGIGHSITNITNSVKTIVHSRFNNFKSELSFLLIDKISGNLPSLGIDATHFKIPPNVTLADFEFSKPSKVDLLLGASIFWDLICVGQIKLGKNQPVIQKTKLGWVISGPVLGFSEVQSNTVTCNFSSNVQIQKQLEKFWEVEECQQKKPLSREELNCEKIFRETTKRDEKGRFIVNLPLRNNVQKLGDSFGIARKRFLQLENRLNKDVHMKNQYHAFIKEYIELGHMTCLGSSEEFGKGIENGYPLYYLPHHGVFKETSLTTKCRVVFDGSACTDTGISLNDVLMVGPKLQDNLFNILLRFRKHAIVIAGDVEKMYRQVYIKEEHRDLQRICWRFSPDLPINIYRLNTVTYGTAPASFLAVRCLQQIGFDNKETYPMASRAILNNFYMDDLLLSTESVKEAKMLKVQISKTLKEAGFILRKWTSNHTEVLNNEEDSSEIEHYLSDDKTTKALGLLWNSERDILQYKIAIDDSQTRATKRTILSVTAQIFDPLGLVGPAIIRAKLIMQELWKMKLGWDESLPLNLHTSWVRFRQGIKKLDELEITRQTICTNPTEIQLHCFSDASELAYGSAVYIKSTNQTGSQVKLICAKSRVAPVKTLNLPRLELCAALLTAKLASEVLDSLKLKFNKVQFWSDSTIVLSWLSEEPCYWKTFVANRVAEIQQLTKGHQWHHKSSQDNPADIISRGVDSEVLKSCSLWWNGPIWLINDEQLWPISRFKVPVDIPEVKVIRQAFSVSIETDLFQRFSSLTKLQRVVAYCIRFSRNCKSSSLTRLSGHLTVGEMRNSIEVLIRLAQLQGFDKEIYALSKSKPISNSSNILAFNPFLDDKGLLRVGGRLRNADISYDQKHPILLPKNHSFTKLIIFHEHYKHLHAGSQALLANIRLKYWILSGRSTIKRVLHECVTCFRVRPVNFKHIMGDLPKSRITPSRPFTNCGVDYAGPFGIKANKLRGHKFLKGYLCVFICFATKAVHLELANDLTTEAFMNCFKRFTARRGISQNIYSDNGTNFVGACNELKALYEFLRNPLTQSKFSDHFTETSINWHFIPAHSPHFGGLWESAVKSAKFHLKRIMGNNNFTYDEFNTIITQVEACLNSRPLIPLSEDPDDLNILTPGHFLIGSSLAALPQEDMSLLNVSKLKRYHQLTQMVQHFWAKWSKDYLSQLQQRSKWRASSSNSILRPGTMVILKEDHLPPLKWQLGRVVQVHPGDDGVVRVVSVLTSKGVFKRAASKVCVLPIELV